MPTLDERLRALRGAAPQESVATAVGVSTSAVGKWERGEAEPGAASVAALARHYSVTADYLLGLSDSPQGLRPGDWVMDLDAMDKIRARDYSVLDVGFAVPARFCVMSSAEAMAFAREHKLKRRG